MPRTTRRAGAVDCAPLGDVWDEKSLRSVLKAARDAEKAEAAAALKAETEKATAAEAAGAVSDAADEEVAGINHVALVGAPIVAPVPVPPVRTSPQIEPLDDIPAVEVVGEAIGPIDAMAVPAGVEEIDTVVGDNGDVGCVDDLSEEEAAEEAAEESEDALEEEPIKAKTAAELRAEAAALREESAAMMQKAKAAASSAAEEPKLILYCPVMKVGGKRPVMYVFDPDFDEFSSRKIQRCRWVAHAPASIMDKDYTPNMALCALRGTIDKTKVGVNAGINAKVSLCVNEEGAPQLVKELLKAKRLASFAQ